MINNEYLSYAARILADTNEGLSGSEICKFCNQYAVKYAKTIKHTKLPFAKGVSNKAQVLRENLACFEPDQQFVIIQDLCDLEKFSNNEQVNELKVILTRDYYHLAPQEIAEQILETVNQVKNWLDGYPEAKKYYEGALEKMSCKIYKRNLLDDLRCSLEALVKDILQSKSSVENLKSDLGNYLKENNVNVEIRNLYITLLKFFLEYQNNNVKHNDLSKKIEVDFIFNQTTVLMQFLIVLHKQNS
ncbi:hypothetical protein [Haemophilus parahaemolyticus]|jgi:hypothetical protein|uniref:hypothetical protein n=1 Tax=Haemophilus parahaemolyticus TaxID=735 RepID=UPI000DABCF37|nr:hypothetical protein [Haemophilus parahaemolyticus]RDE81184.1 hypothetical protein DPV86_06860 [Haemophilus parahaemolyticus]